MVHIHRVATFRKPPAEPRSVQTLSKCWFGKIVRCTWPSNVDAGREQASNLHTLAHPLQV